MLTHLQERVAEIVRNLPEARDFAFPGAGGPIARGLISRPTRDLDYFTFPEDQESVGVLRDALERALTMAGLDHSRRALFDRAEARDFLDLAELTRRFELRELMALANEKDPGFDKTRFLEALASFNRFVPADFGLDEGEYEHLRVTVASWRARLGRELRRGSHDRGLEPDR